MVFDEIRAGVPAGKVSRTLTENFIERDQLPSWISTYGTVSETEMHSISDGRGELELQISGEEGGIRLPRVDSSAFREIRIGCAMRMELPDGKDTFSIGFSAIPNSLHHIHGTAITTQASRDSSATVEYSQDGSTSETDAYYDLMRGPQIIEVRLRTHEQGFTVAMGSGDDIVFSETNASYQFNSTASPLIGVENTTNDPSKLWISKIWFEIYHN